MKFIPILIVFIDIRNKILLQFENITEEEMNFIDGYLEKFDCSKNFVNSLLTKKTDIWKKCYLKKSENKKENNKPTNPIIIGNGDGFYDPKDIF